MQKMSVVTVNRFSEKSLKEFKKEVLTLVNKNQPVILIDIDSYGGGVYELIGFMDFLSFIKDKYKSTIVTICQSKAFSAASILFGCGYHRYISKNATLMIHEVASDFYTGKASDSHIQTNELVRLNELIYRILNKNCKRSNRYYQKLIRENGNGDLFLTASQAIQYGLATHIGFPNFEIECV